MSERIGAVAKHVGIINSRTKGKAHIASGLVLASFIVTHFLNHSLGLISVDAMEAGRHVFNLFWRSWLGTTLLYGALLVHFLLALDAVHRRHSLSMPTGELVKIIFGLSVPFLILGHVVGTRVEYMMTGYDKSYPEVLRALWSSAFSATLQITAAIVVWTHGCLGFWFWLRGRGWFPRWAPFLLVFAVVVPVLALMGFVNAAREVSSLPPEPGRYMRDPAILANARVLIFAGLFATIFGTLLAKVLPQVGRVQVRYQGGRSIIVNPGFSVLEASRAAGIPHVSVCGGRGRCSTCRVRILEGLEDLPPPGERERATLAKIRAPRDVRLACQLHPRRDVTIAPLLDAAALAQANLLQPETGASSGQERQVVALFCDLRGFTRLAEQKLPYDVVFLLNRYFAMVGEAVEANGGVVDKFIGDGAISLFGLATDFDEACRQALTATVRLATGMKTLNESFQGELDAPLRIAMGLHGGPAIIGRIGYGKASALTAVGDTINTASRLEGLAKQHDVELAVSARIAETAGLWFSEDASQELMIRGRSATLETLMIPHAADIERFLKVSA